jgi:hypothetical protein
MCLKRERLLAPMGVIKKTSLMIGSMQVLIEEIKELIVIKNQAKSTMQKVE